MELREHILQFQEALRAGHFANEAAVSQGIVLRLLQALRWPVFDSKIVCPQYTVEERRVDYALCNQHGKPIAFIEVKKTGQGEGADRQLFEYAFHVGVPMAVLTDGQEWHFYLPGELGSYEERRVYKLDILERDVDESERRLTRYLDFNSLCSGSAIDAAKQDYRDVTRNREIEAALPNAIEKLIEEQDDILLDLVANKVESLCGYKPHPDKVASFLAESIVVRPLRTTQTSTARMSVAPPSRSPVLPAGQSMSRIGYRLHGQEVPASSARDVMINLFEQLAAADKTFLERFAARPKHGRSRRFIAQDKYDLYPGRPDLCEGHSHMLKSGWWIGTNYSKASIRKIIQMACEVAGIAFGQDLIVNLG